MQGTLLEKLGSKKKTRSGFKQNPFTTNSIKTVKIIECLLCTLLRRDDSPSSSFNFRYFSPSRGLYRGLHMIGRVMVCML